MSEMCMSACHPKLLLSHSSHGRVRRLVIFSAVVTAFVLFYLTELIYLRNGSPTRTPFTIVLGSATLDISKNGKFVPT